MKLCVAKDSALKPPELKVSVLKPRVTKVSVLKIGVRKRCALKPRSVEVRPSEARFAQIDATEVGIKKITTIQIAVAQLICSLALGGLLTSFFCGRFNSLKIRVVNNILVRQVEAIKWLVDKIEMCATARIAPTSAPCLSKD